MACPSRPAGTSFISVPACSRFISRTFVSSSARRSQPLPPYVFSAPGRDAGVLAKVDATSNRQSTSSLTPDEYERISNHDMETLHDNLEIMVEDYGKGNWEVEYSSGVLTLVLPPYGTYVLNKQPPNLQIWMSSPVSGPSRFEWDPQEAQGAGAGVGAGVWKHHRQKDVWLGKLLDEELKVILESSGARDWEEWGGTGLS